MGLCVTNITYLPDRTYLLIPRDPRSGEGGHAAPGALSNIETQAEAHGVSRPPASSRDYGGELHNGRCEAPVDRRATEHPCRARKIFFGCRATLELVEGLREKRWPARCALVRGGGGRQTGSKHPPFETRNPTHSTHTMLRRVQTLGGCGGGVTSIALVPPALRRDSVACERTCTPAESSTCRATPTEGDPANVIATRAMR
mmetsp:Transcript_32548/g.85758  ORF Transcript_32548/g.85758 Transcript_32548/m.85758 type:complete len:201 (-) Transcript_32548:224-826(-)